MTVSRLNLQEYRTYPEPIRLSPEGRDRLVQQAGVAAVAASGSADHYWLTPSSTVGVLTVEPGLVALIQPKVKIGQLVFMLSYVLDPKHWQANPFEFESTGDLLSAVVLAMAHHAESATRRGLLRGYEHIEEAATTVRGRIRIDEQLRHRFGLVPPIEVAYDEYTENISENLLPRAALHALGRLQLTAGPRLRLREAVARFQGVELRVYHPARLPIVSYTRLNEHYRSLVELARLVLRNISFEYAHGDVVGVTFLVDMNRLFENFMYTALLESLNAQPGDFQHGVRIASLDVSGQIELKPDLSWWAGRRLRWLGDLKYQKPTPEAVPNADLYQMLAYLVASDLADGLLIYPRTEGAPAGYQVRHLAKSITVTTVDLGGSQQHLLGEVARIGAQIRAMASAPADTKAG